MKTKLINFRKVVGSYSNQFPAFDITTSWFEWLSYCEVCESLNVKGQPSIGRFLRYRRYLKEVGVI